MQKSAHCYTCRKPGHIARDCRANKTSFNQNQRNTQNLRFNTQQRFNPNPTFNQSKYNNSSSQNNTRRNDGQQRRPDNNQRSPFWNTHPPFQNNRQFPNTSNRTKKQRHNSRQQQDFRPQKPRLKNQTLRTTLLKTSHRTTYRETAHQQNTLNAIFHQIQLQLKQKTRKTNAQSSHFHRQWPKKHLLSTSKYRLIIVHLARQTIIFQNNSPPHPPIPRDFYNSAQMRGRFRLHFPS